MYQVRSVSAQRCLRVLELIDQRLRAGRTGELKLCVSLLFPYLMVRPKRLTTDHLLPVRRLESSHHLFKHACCLEPYLPGRKHKHPEP
jgi:hypothetical protein